MSNFLDPGQVNSVDQAAFDWRVSDFLGKEHRELKSAADVDYRFFHISEISTDKATANRLAMSNVLSILNNSNASVVYLLSGKPEGIDLYMGVAKLGSGHQAHGSAQLLQSALDGNFPGMRLKPVYQDNADLVNLLSTSGHLGCVMGVPSFNEQAQDPEQQDFQGIERLVNSLQGETWQLLVIAEPGQDDELRILLDELYDLSTELSVHTKQSVQQSENQGSQNSYTEGQNTGRSEGWNTGENVSKTRGTNTGQSRSLTKGVSETKGLSNSSNGNSSGRDKSRTTNDGTSESGSSGSSESDSTAISKGSSHGKSWGDSHSTTTGSNNSLGISLTRERINKPIEEMQKHLSETVIERFRLGRSKGMFRTGIYLNAETALTYERLSQSVLSIFQGNQAETTPLQVKKLPKAANALHEVLQFRHYPVSNLAKQRNTLLAHGVPFSEHENHVTAATWLNTRELALLTGFPSRELPGVMLRKSVDFAVNTGDLNAHEQATALNLGSLVQHGRILTNNPVRLPLKDLNKHIFITGVTGSGKTTTCMKLLQESNLPFLVVEPAKTEYRALYARGEKVDYYLPGREDVTPFRLNPFELVHPKQNLAGHVSVLTATLTAVYPMEAAMPQLVEEAIIAAYKTYGWDIQSGENLFEKDPWSADVEVAGKYWPTFDDMIAELDALIQSKGMGKEFEEKYRGSLVARLTNLTLGIKGRMLNTRRSLNFDQLLDKKVVIELEELKDEQDKALFMGLIITRLAECMKQRHREQPHFQHLTLIEEAHRLLARPEPGVSDARKMGVEMFANLLSEVRKYGEGLIIADQIPNKLIPDVIKNTHTKIVHRLFAADDRNTIGDSMSLNDEQKDFLPLLQTGETVVYCGGWHAPARVQIKQGAQTDDEELPEEKLLEKGRQQLWEQRHQLVPRVSGMEAVSEAGELASFLRNGIRTLNSFLEWIALHKTSGADEERKEKLFQGFCQGFSTLKAELQKDEGTLANMLFSLFLDAASISVKDASDRIFETQGPELMLDVLHQKSWTGTSPSGLPMTFLRSQN